MQYHVTSDRNTNHSHMIKACVIHRQYFSQEKQTLSLVLRFIEVSKDGFLNFRELVV